MYRRKLKSQWLSSVAVLGPDNLMVLVMDKSKPRPHLWKFPGGRSEKDELPEITARREVKEETGLDINGLEFLASEGRKNHTALLFAAQTKSFATLKHLGNDGELIRLIHPRELVTMKNFLPEHRRLLLKAGIRT